MTEPSASVETQLAVINTKLDTLIDQRGDHEGRLRGLEQARWKLTGMASVGGALAGGLVAFLK
jgi:hypothetical protein